MKTPHTLLLAVAPFATAPLLHSAALLSPGDFIIAVDGNRNLPSAVTSPGGEDQYKLFDSNSATKLFTGGRAFSGVIVTPAEGSTVVRSIAFTTANDSSNRDPVQYQLFGTNDAISSGQNSAGTAENWTLISSGSTGIAPASAAATARLTTAPLIPLANAAGFTSYKIVFPELRSGGDAANSPSTPNGLQLADIRMFSDVGGTTPLFAAPSTGVLAIDQTDSFYPVTERPFEAIDGIKTSGSKYLNFGREGTGFIVTPTVGSSVVQGFQITTANDTDGRDPASYELYGTNLAILSLDNSEGTAENWTLISSGALDLPTARNVDDDLVTFANTTAFTSYKMIFPENRGPDGGSVNSIQFSEIQFFSNVPEPVSAGFVALSTALLALRRRRQG